MSSLTDSLSPAATRVYAKKLFAELAMRIVAFGVDLLVVLFTASFINDHLSVSTNFDHTIILVLMLFLYFAACWTSPMRATPIQFLFGLRVLRQSGTPLVARAAAIRSAALIAVLGATIGAFKLLSSPYIIVTAALVAILLFSTAVTSHRQALHDFLARSIVVNQRAIRSPEAKERMHEFLANDNPVSRRHRRPSVFSMTIDAIVLAVPLFVLTTAVQVAKDKNMRARTAYAIQQVQELQTAVAEFYEETSRWPNNEFDLGVPVRREYPDGGFYALEKNGVIRIQFTVRPELKNGSILISPKLDGKAFDWQCRTAGDIEPRYLPYHCRN